MDLKEYIKNINDYLIAEDFSEGTSETMEDKSKQLQDLKLFYLILYDDQAFSFLGEYGCLYDH